MIKYHYIKVEYKVENDDPIIFLIGREINTLQKRIFRVTGFEPYFYAKEEEAVPNSTMIKRVESGFKTLFGEPCKKIVVTIPSDVRELKKYFSWTGEADIVFPRRFLIDTGIKTYFSVPENKDEIHYKEIIGE